MEGHNPHPYIHPDRWGIIYCPKREALTSPVKRWKIIEQTLQQQGVNYDYVQSEHRGSVARLMKMMVNNGYRTIIIVGGDSALNDAVNVLMNEENSVREQVAIGVIPNGVMNDFARFWEMDQADYAQLVKWLIQRRTRKVDVGCLRYTNQKKEPCRRYFLNCVNVGLVAAITSTRTRLRRFVGVRPLSMALSGALMLYTRLDYKMHLRINGEDLRQRVMTLCIGNAPAYGQTPSAVPYNGWLDVSIVSPSRITQLLAGLRLFMQGKLLNHRGVHPYRTRRVDILSAPYAQVSVDGRAMNRPKGSMSVTVEQEAIQFIIPS